MFRTLFLGTALSSGLLVAGPAWTEVDPGAYLAARQAAISSDYDVAARYYTQALLSDPANPTLLENAMSSYLALGQIDQAAPIARTMTELDIRSQVSHLVQMTVATRDGDWNAIFDALEAGRTVSPLFDGLTRAWAALGQGDVGRALGKFDEVTEGDGMGPYGVYHKALALASVGDFEGADALLSDPARSLRHTARSAIAHAQILSQLERNVDALALIDSVFGNTRNPEIAALKARLSAGEPLPYDVVTTPQQGVAEAAFMVAMALKGETHSGYTLQYARVGALLDPRNTQAILLCAELLDELEQYDLANVTYKSVPDTDPAYVQAELGRIDALRHGGRIEAATEAAEALARSQPDLPFVQSKLGDVLRMQDRMEEARDAYSRALDTYGADDEARWIVYYTRAIAHHQLDLWPEAEADFRAALEVQPDQPQVLNYLGYSLVERGEKLDEALRMIETAVAAEPQNGAIVDSLGWVYFQLGRYDEAVEPLERAASLEAVDPIINDHLGDAYWAVGRVTEAHFQWQRALSFDPDEELAERIRRKLEVGLDVVLAEEGAAPLTVAHDEG